MFAHGETGLAAAYNDRFDFLDCHVWAIIIQLPVS
jgi:hypothetical protein